MAKVFTSMAALQAAIMKEVTAGVQEAVDETHGDARRELSGFYGQGHPINYERTGTLGETPRKTGVSSGGNTASGEVYLDQGISYSTGNFSGSQVIDAAEVNGYRILGRGGFWERTENEAQENLDSAMGKRFK